MYLCQLIALPFARVHRFPRDGTCLVQKPGSLGYLATVIASDVRRRCSPTRPTRPTDSPVSGSLVFKRGRGARLSGGLLTPRKALYSATADKIGMCPVSDAVAQWQCVLSPTLVRQHTCPAWPIACVCRVPHSVDMESGSER